MFGTSIQAHNAGGADARAAADTGKKRKLATHVLAVHHAFITSLLVTQGNSAFGIIFSSCNGASLCGARTPLV